ncbi:MAG TPA: ABC transporter permease [Actinomycetes bacterium]
MILEAVRLAAGRLRANLLRSMLTVIGLVIGVGSVVTLVSVGNGSAADVNDQFSRLGANTLTVTGGRGFGFGVAGLTGSNKTLTLADTRALERLDSVKAVAPTVQAQETITNGGTSVQASVTGTTTAIQNVDDLQLAGGRFFSGFAQDRGLKLGVLGASLAQDLGLDGRTAVGRTLDVGTEHYLVVGVLKTSGFGPLSQDDNLLVPLNAIKGRLVSSDPKVDQLRVAAEPEATDRYRNDVIATLRSTHQLGADDDNDFVTRDPTTLIQARQESSTNFTRLITAIAAISLIVGGIGVANVMLVAVRERIKEIGIRRAVGARRRDIVAQFLTEATVLSVIGGLLGVAAGLATAYALPHLSEQRTIVSYPAAALALGISALVGIIAGFGPANQAAALDPATALRYE